MRTPDSPAAVHRGMKRRSSQMQPGVLLSFTTVRHPPKGFPEEARLIGLIALQDGTKVIGHLLATGRLTPEIGQEVVPRMLRERINEQGLKIYNVVYELTARKTAERSLIHHPTFPGYILALTGPSGVGKSTVSRLLVQLMHEFAANVPIVTTRKPKKGDESEYCYVSIEEFQKLKASGDLFVFTRIPSETEQRWYGYRASDVEAIWKAGKLPVVVTETELLKGIVKHYGRRTLLSFGLLPPGRSRRAMLSALLFRLRKRGRDTEEHIRERIKNAESDLKFFDECRDLFDDVIVNDSVEAVVEVLRGRVMSVQEA